MNLASTRTLATFLALCLGVSAIGFPAVALPADAAPDDDSAGVTYVERDVTEDATWSAEDGPYRIAADVTVVEGATLTVEPGTTVQPAADVTIAVEGNLSAEGTAADPITVSTAPEAPDDVRWASIRYEGTSRSALSLTHVTVENATNALLVGSSRGRVELSAVTVRNVGRNGIKVVNATGTPELTVSDSTFTDVGRRGVTVTPGTGSVGDATLTSNSTQFGNRTEHQLRLPVGADTTVDAFRVAYHGHGDVNEVDFDSLRTFGLDLTGSGTVDRSLKPMVETVAHPTANAYEIRLANAVTVPADAAVVAAYDDVVNPRTYGTYPVTAEFRANGVRQTAAKSLPFDLRSSGDRPRADRRSEQSRASRFSITESTFDSIGEQGVFVGADVTRRFRIADNSFADTRGSGITIRGRQVDSMVVDGNRLSAIGDDADGIRIAAQRATDLQLRNNHVSEADAGVGFFARNENVDEVRFDSNVVTDSTTGIRVRYDGFLPRRVSLTFTDNVLSDNDRRGISVDAESTRLRGLTVRGNEITDNGETGLYLDGPLIAWTTVRNNEIEENDGGIRLEAVRLLNTAVRNNSVAENRGHGLSLRSSIVAHNVSVDGNRVFDNAGIGIDVDSQLTHAGAVNLTRNVVAANAYGVRIAGAFGGRVSNNTVVYNTYGLDAPVGTQDYRPGTGIVVEEGDAGAIFRTGDVSEELATLIDDPRVEDTLERRHRDEYMVVLRPGRESYVRASDDTALTVRSLSEDIPTGVILRKDDDRRGIVVRHNDVYGHRRGMTVNVSTLVDANTTTRLLVNATRTVVAERNYWGAPTGPTHDSIHPEGTGDRIVTRRGWVDFVPAASSPFRTRYRRPVANVTVSPNPATVGDRVVVSGEESSDGDGRVASYRFVIDGPSNDTEPNVTSSTDPNVVVSPAETGRYEVSLVVEDEFGVESAEPATATVGVRRQAAMSASTTPSTTTTGQTTTLPSTTESGFLPPLGIFTTLGGLLGFVCYGGALALGAFGTIQTFRRAGVPFGGTTINGLAVAGVGVWVVFGLLGTDGLLALGVGGGVLWVALVVLLWAATRLLFE